MGQMRMKIESRNSVEQPEFVQVFDDREWSDLFCAFDDRRTKSVLIQDRHSQGLHDRTSVLPEPLLAWNERIAVMRVFQLPLLHVFGESHVVMRAQQQTGPIAFQPLADRLNFTGRSLLL